MGVNLFKIVFWRSVMFGIVLLTLSMSCQKSEDIPDIDFNKGWVFYKGEATGAESLEFDDSEWRNVDLPHDWAIEGPFSKEYNARTGGLPVHGTGWYRKVFTIDKKNIEKCISVEFDGAMSNSHVWINGHLVGNRPFGYLGFECDLTRYINYKGPNVIAVRLRPEDLSSRWYPGAGIYRNVRLKLNNKLHISQWGTTVTTPSISESQAEIHLTTNINNQYKEEQSAILFTSILDSEGNVLTGIKTNVVIQPGKTGMAKQELKIKNVNKWDTDHPYLYTAVSQILQDDIIKDEYITEFGVREISFTCENGFLLNGKNTKFKGVCMHHDLGPLGTAVNYRATERQVEILKQMGANAIRTSHNPPSPELLQICDRLGMLVQVEAFDEWKIGKVKNGYNKYFEAWHNKDLRDMIRRDKNHPSIVMWSIGNEILEQNTPDGWKITKKLNDICHEEDPTRPTTAGFNYYPAPFTNKLANYVDIVGLNYWPLNYQDVINKNPNLIVYGSETSSQTSSRGIYHHPIEFKEQHHTNQVSSYDAIVGPPWAYPPDVEFEQQELNPHSLGEFIWTGFDYLGEPTPYGGEDNKSHGSWNTDWPSRSSYFGPIDLCGLPKDRYYLYQSQWTSKPMIHILPHWNWRGMEGQKIPVFAYTNCEEAELFLNGKSLGRKQKGKDLTAIPAEFHGFEKGLYHSKYRLSWDVPYQAGQLKVIGYNKGKAVTEKEINTAGDPYKIILEADRTTIKADDYDLSYITFCIEDKNGNLCPLADNRVQFTVSGQGNIEAIGNGDPTSLEVFKSDNRKAFNGFGMLIVRSTNTKGKIEIKASSDGLVSNPLTILTN